MWRDCEYRTGLGTCFYNRLREVETLSRLLEKAGTIIVYGPRNVGKSELARYVVTHRDFPIIRVDARQSTARSFVRVAGFKDVERLAREAAERLLRLLLGEHAAGLVALVEEAWRLLRSAVRGKKLVILVDEFHLLPSVRSDTVTALTDLEAVAGLIAKNVDFKVVLLVTVSEGFVAKREALAKLLGYNVAWLVVEQLDYEHFQALHKEYVERHGCALGPRTLFKLAGGTPGLLPQLCSDEHTVAKWVEAQLLIIDTVVSEARRTLGLEDERLRDPRRILEAICLLLSGHQVDVIEEPIMDKLGQMLTSHNLAYPVYSGVYAAEKPKAHVVYKPAYPVIREAVCKATEEGRAATRGLVEDLIRAAQSEDTGSSGA